MIEVMQNHEYLYADHYADQPIQYNHIIYKMLQAQQKQDPTAIKEGQAQEISETSSKNNHQSNVYYTKNKKIIFWLYLFVGLIFVVSQATLVSKNWENYQTFSTSDSFYLANQVATEWGKGFITGIQITNSVDCPAGYESAFNFTWPGSSFGCFCQVNSNSSFVLQGYCSPKLIQSSCRNIQSKQEIIATIWKNSAHICMKRSSVSFKTQQRYNGQNKICGSSKSLTIMPNSQPCPFVNATFGIPTLEDHYLQFTDSSSLLSALYGTYNSTSPYSFYSYPISKFAVSEYEFCLIDEDGGLTPDRVQFVLLNQRRGCADPGVYQTLDSITQMQFYANNPKLNALSSTNGFPKPGSQTYNLGFANLPSWTYNCRHNYDKKFSIPKALQIINFQFFKSYYYVALVQILLYSVLGFQIFILVIRRLLKKEVYPVGYRQMYLPKDFCLALTRYIIDFSCKFVILGLLIYTAWVIFVNWNWFKSSLNLGCPDNDEMLINNVMEPFRTMYQQSLVYVVSQLVVFTFVATIDIIHFIYIYRKDLRYYLVDSYGKVMVEHEARDELDWIDKQGDKNLLIIDKLGQKDDGNDAVSQKFRMTMAMNLNDNERLQNEPGKPRIVKKKKKKIGFFKNYENIQAKKSDQFNPFTIDDPSIIGLNSIDNLSGERKQQDDGQQFKIIKKGDRKRRKK